MYKAVIRPVLFLFAPETAHRVTLAFLNFQFLFPGVGALYKAIFSYKHVSLQQKLAGINFQNPVGLAAGFDKNASGYKALARFGFGFIEIGTVTPLPQDGNPKPRIFRLLKDQAMINRLGFNNDGMNRIAGRLRTKNPNLIIGVNIGKNKSTDISAAKEDYLKCFQTLHDVADYFTINISSPNTPGLLDLQEKDKLLEIIQMLRDWESRKKIRKPIMVKLSPDIELNSLNEIIDVIKPAGAEGVVIANTSISRVGLSSTINDNGEGGLSGKPIKDLSTKMIKHIRQHAGQDLIIIGVGGIHDEASALEKLDAGANLIQLYTGFIYEGPGLVKRINQAIVNKAN